MVSTVSRMLRQGSTACCLDSLSSALLLSIYFQFPIRQFDDERGFQDV